MRASPAAATPDASPPAHRAPAVEAARGYALGALAWLALAIPFALQHGLASREMGRPVSWSGAFAHALLSFSACLPLLPLLGWAVRRYPLRPGRVAAHAGVLLGAVLVAGVVRQFAIAPLVLPLLDVRRHHAPGVAGALGDAMVYLAAVTVLHARLSWREARARELEAARLARRLAETQLAALRAQLQPHFLFNTLNAISALMRDEPDVADRMLTRLAELLRVVLDPPPGDEHALGDELGVLDRYLEIMRLRFGARLTVDVHVPEALRAACVPWLVLQPLVENALEHGAGRRRGGVHVRIDAAREADGRLVLAVCDDGPGPRAGIADAARRGGGIGLANTRRRLAELHGDAASLVLEPRPEGGACARVVLPWRPAAASPSRALPARPAMAAALS